MYRRLSVAFCRDDTAQDVIEYALLLAFIALVAIAALSNVATNIESVWNAVGDATSDAITALS